MIIKAGENWNGTDNGRKNLDSKMDFEEHRRIVSEARRLLAGNLGVENNGAGESLKKLKAAYEAGNPRDVLHITKGIHQRVSNPHITLWLQHSQSRFTYTFHLNVSTLDAPGLPEEYFHWVGVQFTAEVNGSKAEWPVGDPSDAKYGRRRHSIAPENLRSKLEEIARQEQEEERKAREEERKAREAREEEERKKQAQLDQSNRARACHVITQQLKTEGWTIETGGTNPSIQINKLIDGKSILVKTKKDKKINVKFENGKVKPA
jgi:hypothetical protein